MPNPRQLMATNVSLGTVRSTSGCSTSVNADDTLKMALTGCHIAPNTAMMEKRCTPDPTMYNMNAWRQWVERNEAQEGKGEGTNAETDKT